MDERHELLIQRVLDRCDTPQDWQELHERAVHRPETWRELAATLCDDCLLRTATAPLLAAADRVAVPAPRLRLGAVVRAWSGWAASAVIGLSWAIASSPPGLPSPGSGNDRRVLGELPRLLVEATPTADGARLRVVSLRRMLEETTVAAAMRVGADETGVRHAVPVELASLATPTDY